VILEIARPCRKVDECCKVKTCCEFGSGMLIASDIPKIAAYLGISEELLKDNLLERVTRLNRVMYRPRLLRKGKPYGPCVFFDKEQRCTIHEVKPLQCRTALCNEKGPALEQWFALNYILDREDGAALAEWKQYLKQNPPIPGGSIGELKKEKKG